MWKMKVKTWQAIVITVLVLETAFLIWAGNLMRKAMVIDELNAQIEGQNNYPYIYSKRETSEMIIEQWQKLEKRKLVSTSKKEDKKQTILISGQKGQAAGRDVKGDIKWYIEENGKKTVRTSKSTTLSGAVVDNYFLYSAGGIMGTIQYAHNAKVTTQKVDGKACYVVTIYPQKQDIADYPRVRLEETAKKVKLYYEKERGLPLKAEVEYDDNTEIVTYDYVFDSVDDSVFQEPEGY